jgi:hypothetical protein
MTRVRAACIQPDAEDWRPFIAVPSAPHSILNSVQPLPRGISCQDSAHDRADRRSSDSSGLNARAFGSFSNAAVIRAQRHPAAEYK